ncbi:MAG: FtsX-like permease family protein [Gammaproteobacteria bacterium]|nr:FtsX-like permease family protein [Gammaproteobacteria bacterium]
MRTSLAILGIALGVMLITSLLFIMDGLESSIADSLELLSGNLIIQEEGAIDQTLSIVNASLIEDLRSNEDIKVISPEIYVARNLPGGAGPRFITLIGVTDSYREIVSPGYIKIGTFFNATDSGKIVLGSKLADRLGLKVGDIFPIDSTTFDVTGIFETNTIADVMIALIPIEDARALRNLSEDQISVIEVRPVDPNKADEIRSYVESNFEDYEVVFPEDLVKEATEIMGTLRNTVWLVSAIAVLIGGIGIANAMLMSVMERTPEIGLLKATGWRNIDVGYSVLIEALGIGVIGGLIGLLLGMVAAQTAQNIIPALTVRLTLITILESLIFGVGLSLGSGVYPAVKAARLSPIRAIRGE